MASNGNRTPYTVVSAHLDGYGSMQTGQRKRGGRQLNYKPIPLRIPFLSTCALIFAICAVLIELLLRNAAAYVPPDSSTKTPSTLSSIAARSIATTRSRKLAHRDTSDDSQLPATYCANAAAIPSQIAMNRQSSDSLCSEFTASFQGHTANMSYPMQTSVSQWLGEFNSVTAAYWDLRLTSLQCTPSARGPNSWTVVTADVGCATSITPLTAPCTGFGTMYITGFQLTSTILPVCGVTTDNQLVQTTQPRNNPSIPPSPTNTASILVPGTQPRTSYTVIGSNELDPTTQPRDDPTSRPTITSSILIPTTQSRVTTVIGSQELDPTQGPPRTTDTSQVPNSPSDNGFGLGLTTVTLSASTAASSPPTQIFSDSSPIGNSNPAQGTTIIGVQVQASKTLVTEVVGSRTTVVDNGSTQSPSSQTFTQVVDGNTVVTVVPVLSSATSGTTVTAIVNGNTVLTTIPVSSPANNNLLVSTVVNGQTIVTELSKTAVTAIVNGQTIVTDVLSTGTGILKSVITELVSGTTITTEVGLVPSTTAYGTNKAVADSNTAPIHTTTTQYISVMTTTGKDGKTTTFSAVVVQTVFETSAGPTGTNSTGSASVTRPPQPTLTLSSADVVVSGSFTTASYFAAQYLPALVAVMIKALWEMVFAAVKLVSPFERMNRPEGATGEYSIFAQYLSTSLSLDVVRSLGHKNFIPFIAAFALVVVQIGTPLSTAAMNVRASDICLINGHTRPCAPIWIVNTIMLRVVQGALIACVLIAVLLAILMYRFRSGVSSDPSSIGALALLMNHEQLNRDIQRINPETDYNLFEEALQNHRFWLSYHKGDGVSRYGIMGSKETDSFSPTSFRNRTTYSYHQVTNPGLDNVTPENELDSDAQSSFSRHSNSYTQTSILTRMRDALITDTLGLLVIATLFSLIVAFYLDGRADVLNDFFNSGSVISRFIFVGLAVIASLQMSHIERVIRITEPFRRLATNFRHGVLTPHETTLLVSRAGTPYSSLPQCISLLVTHEAHGGRMTFQTLVSITAILSDLNIIAVSGIAFNDAQTVAVYQGSSISGIALSSTILLMWLVIFVWWRRNKTVKTVRAMKGAGTIGGMMRYLAGGGKEIVDEVARIAEEREMRDDTGRVDGRGRDSGLKPCFGRFLGSDGRDRWCVGFLRVEEDEKRVAWG